MRCIGCPNSVFRNPISFISMDAFKACLENLDIDFLHHIRLFNYGEPLLHPNLLDLILEIPKFNWWKKDNSTGSYLEISTNGQFEDFSMLIEVFKTKELSLLVVSCDGDGTKEDYERMRPPAKWEVFLNFLDTVNEIRNKYSPNTKLMTRTICVIPEHRERWRQILIPRGWEIEFRGWIYLPGIKPHPPVTNRHCVFIKCAFSGVTFNLNSEGLVVPCCAHPKAEILGDLKIQKYNDVLKSEVYINFANRLLVDRVGHPICGECVL